MFLPCVLMTRSYKPLAIMYEDRSNENENIYEESQIIEYESQNIIKYIRLEE